MIDSRILIGLLSILIAVSGITYIAIGEADRQEEFKQAFHGRSIENGAAVFGEYCSPCHGINGQGISGKAPALNTKHFFTKRLDEIGYQGSLKSYVSLTVASGRPVQSGDGPWVQNMPTWSIDYGGPLRNDQIGNVVNFIMNWESTAPEEGDIVIDVTGDTPEEQGESLFLSLGCIGCHIVNGEGAGVGPELTKVYQKGEDYIRQSIVDPNAVIAEGYPENVMPQTFGDQLSDEQIDLIISYLKSVNEGN